MIFLAGLQAVPDELYEAASIDGANAWQRFRRITLPLMKPLIAIQLLFGVIYSVYQFAIPYVMMGTNPGPYADLLMTLVVRQAFTNNLFGYGAAISTLADVRDARLGRRLVPELPPLPGAADVIRRRSIEWSLNALTSSGADARADRLARAVVAADLEPAGDRHVRLQAPDADAFRTMWDAVDFERYFRNSLIICTAAALFATAFARVRGLRARARWRFRGSASSA